MIRSIWDELADLETRVEEAFATPGRPTRGLLGPGQGVRPFIPVTDVYTRDGDMVVRLDLPGLDPAKEVTVQVEEGHLVIRGERHRETRVEKKDYYRMETFEGSFERHVALPDGADPAKIKAGYHNGVLEVVVPGGAKVRTRARAIPIKVTTH